MVAGLGCDHVHGAKRNGRPKAPAIRFLPAALSGTPDQRGVQPSLRPVARRASRPAAPARDSLRSLRQQRDRIGQDRGRFAQQRIRALLRPASRARRPRRRRARWPAGRRRSSSASGSSARPSALRSAWRCLRLASYLSRSARRSASLSEIDFFARSSRNSRHVLAPTTGIPCPWPRARRAAHRGVGSSGAKLPYCVCGDRGDARPRQRVVVGALAELAGVDASPGSAMSGTTPLCCVLPPSTRKNCAMVSLTWPNCVAVVLPASGRGRPGSAPCPCRRSVSPMIRPRP